MELISLYYILVITVSKQDTPCPARDLSGYNVLLDKNFLLLVRLMYNFDI